MCRPFLACVFCFLPGCCGLANAQGQPRFIDLDMRITRSPRMPLFPRRQACYDDGPGSWGGPSAAAYDAREREELDFRFRRQGPSGYLFPPPRPAPYEAPCGSNWMPSGARQWLLQELPSGRLRLWALSPDD